MAKPPSHQSKTVLERGIYQAYIKEKQDDATLDESLNFHSSSQLGSSTIQTQSSNKAISLGRQTSSHKRNSSFWSKAEQNISQHKVEWVFGIILALLVYFASDAKIDMAVLHTQFDNLNKNTDKLESSFNSKFDHFQEQLDNSNSSIESIKGNYFNQEISIDELMTRIQFIEKQLDKK